MSSPQSSTVFADKAQSFDRAGWGIVLSLLCIVLGSWLRCYFAGTMEGAERKMPFLQETTCGILGAVGLTGAGVFFGKAWFSSPGKNLRSLLPIALAIHLVAFAALPMTSSDIFSGIAYGREVLAGLNPFRDGPSDLGSDPIVAFVDPKWIHWQACYGPLTTSLSALTAWPASVWGAVLLFKLAMLSCSLGAIGIAYDFCRRLLSPEQASQSFVLLAWNPLLAWEISGQAHNDGLLVLGLTAFVWAATRERQWLAAAALILGVYLKFAALPVLGLYGLYVARRRLGRALMMGMALIVAGVAFFAPYWDGAATLGPALQASTAHPDYLVNSLTWLACNAGMRIDPHAGPAIFRTMLYATRLVCLVLAATFALRARSVTRVLQDGFIFLLVFECLAMGWFEPWYATWLVPLAMGSGDWRLQRIAGIYTGSLSVLYLPEYCVCIGLPIVQLLPLVLLLLRQLPSKQAEQIALPMLTQV
jgi:hypothetical protein